jgi:uncharacterized protein YkwD
MIGRTPRLGSAVRMSPRSSVRAGILAICASLLSACIVVGGPSTISTGTGPPPQSAPAGTSSAPVEERIEREVFDRVNAEREERGLDPLAWNDALADVASDWSAEMAASGRFEHQDIAEVMQGEQLNGFSGVGENIFSSTGPVPAGAIHVGWMESEGHRVNVLNPGWNRIGIGVHCAEDGSVWATQEFGRTVDADLPQVSDEAPPEQPIVRPEKDGPRCA